MSTGSIELGNDGRFWIQRVIVAGALGAASVFYLANLGNYLDTQWEVRQLAGYSFQPREFIGAFVVGAVLFGALFIGSWWARQPHGARVEWDDKVITEHDGAAIRACIPWSTALQHKVEVWERTKGGGRRPGGVLVQISDAAGRLITVNGSSLSWPWMLTRRMHAQTVMLELWNQVGTLPAGKPLAPDPASLRRPSSKLWTFLTFAASVAIGIGLVLLYREREAPIPIALGTLALMLTTFLKPGRELWRLRDARGAVHVPLDGRLDLSSLVHPDALIATRREGGAWVVKSADGVVTELETDAACDNRKTLARAVMLEIALRFVLVFALVFLLVLREIVRKGRAG
jgi:hypothetical protein